MRLSAYISILYLLILAQDVTAQVSRDCFKNSIFRAQIVSSLDADPGDTGYYEYYSYYIFGVNECLSFALEYPEYNLLSKYAFAASIFESGIDFPVDLQDNGEGIVFYDEDPPLGSFMSYLVGCNEEYMFIDHGPPDFFRLSVDDLEYTVLKVISSEGEKRNRNLFVDFLELDIRAVCTDQVDVFDNVNGTQKGYLVRGDLVEVIAQQGDWAHIKYLKTNKEYWTYQSCLE